MKRGLMIAIICALLAGSAGYVAHRLIFGPTDQERAYTKALDAAKAAGNVTEYQRLRGDLAVTVSPGEMLFTMGPVVLILGAYALVGYGRRRQQHPVVDV